MPYTYADIPDSMKTKKFVPLARHLWNINKHLGHEIVLTMIEACPEYIYPELKERLDATIHTAKAIIEGKIDDPLKLITYTLFPPVINIRGDLGQGSMKLIFGESIDTTFVVLNDVEDGEIFFILNGHSEDGIPVDWWVAGPDDELLDRRHIKLGYKIRDLPKKTKNLTQAGNNLIDILKDIRNERAPQWATSSYLIGMVWGTGMANVLAERSNWEAIANIWDGVNPKKYNLPDYWFAFIPWPTLLKTLTMMPRTAFTLRMAGLTTGSQFAIGCIEETGEKWLKENFPEIWKVAFVDQMETGIPMPRHTIGCKLPDTKKKVTYEKNLFEWDYPDTDFLKMGEINVTLEEIVRGIFLDIDHEFEGRPKPSNIISMGTGLNTKIIK
ncbi:MAG: hypothetical protein ACTSQI_05645 [Candidatus Helarchaeota archaeon]